MLAPDGTVSAPSYSFSNSPTSGMYSPGVNQVALVTNGASALAIDSSQKSTFGGAVYFQDGAVGTPGISFVADTNTGFYRSGSDSFLAVANGANVCQFLTTGISITGSITIQNGAAATPSLSNSAGTTGIYFTAAPLFGITIAGVSQFEMDGTSLFYRGGSTEIRKSLSGSEVANITRNQSNTASSNAVVQTVVAGTSAGDAYYNSQITSGSSWAWGARNSDSDSWYLSPGADLSTSPAVKVTVGGDVSIPTGNLIVSTAGKGLQIKEGSNAKMGTATLSGGTVVVSTTAVTASSRIFLTAQSLGTVSVGQGLAVSARSAGTSFTILSGSAIDTSTVAWMIVEPS